MQISLKINKNQIKINIYYLYPKIYQEFLKILLISEDYIILIKPSLINLEIFDLFYLLSI
ncbi:TPA: hypothetical protein DEG21_00065 [Patescibacteria group bacterium]|nr:hypothetical protein [Candidatus Gracilibacteria bacterium]HBY74325.1 hypothetical protein [Candidatus Gracilibacteria bacterium]